MAMPTYDQFLQERQTAQADLRSKVDNINKLMADSGQQYVVDPTDPNKLILIPTTNPFTLYSEGTSSSTPGSTPATDTSATNPLTEVEQALIAADLEKKAKATGITKAQSPAAAIMQSKQAPPGGSETSTTPPGGSETSTTPPAISTTKQKSVVDIVGGWLSKLGNLGNIGK